MRTTDNFFRSLILGLCFLTLSADAQQVTTSTNRTLRQGYYTFGINGGLAYQSSDVRAQVFDGFGLGLTLAKNYYYKPGSLFRFDLRGRLLYSQTYGGDQKASFGLANNNALNGTPRFDEVSAPINYLLPTESQYVFSNHKTHLGELGLEGVVMLNRLRERTKWVVSLYGGLNLDWYNVFIDQKEDNGTYSEKYQGFNTSKTDIATLEAVRDGIYETVGDGFKSDIGRLRIMPSLGLEVGRELLPHFILGIGHKVNFTRTDIFDGQRWKNDNTATGNNDLHHYTYLQMLWEFNKCEKKQDPPIITFVQPDYSPYTSNESTFDIVATVKNVNSAADINMNVNDGQVAFNFNKSNGRLNRTIQLRPGSNLVVIKASNMAGSDEKSVTIIYNERKDPEGAKPAVSFTNPPTTPYSVQQSAFVMNAEATQINNNQDISFYLNGNVRSTQYDTRTKVISASLNLIEGANNLRIVVRNKYGQAETTATVNYVRKQDGPEVRFTNPSYSPFETESNFINLTASVRNVDSRNDITYEVNGNRTNDFTFDGNRGTWTSGIRLREGENNIRLSAYNNTGSAEDYVRVIYRRAILPPPPPPMERPVVKIENIDEPIQDRASCKSTVRAKLRNVDSESDIQVFLNGRSTSNFSYNRFSGTLTASITLSEGANEIRIKGSNRAGSDEDQARVNGCKKVIQQHAPIITITEPYESVKNVGDKNFTLVATVLNVNSKNEITFKQNGSSKGFNFDQNTKILTATVVLGDGNNALTVTAENEGGRDQKSVDIRYLVAPVVLKPVMKIEQPENEARTTSATVDFKGKATNIGSNDLVELSINGKVVPNISINKLSKSVTSRLALNDGANTIRLYGRNQAGSDSASVIIYKDEIKPEVPKPELKFVMPGLSGKVTSSSSYDVIATAKNITREDQLQVNLNGGVVRFKFSPINGSITFKAALKEGENRIDITATNEAGQSFIETTIIKTVSAVKPMVEINSLSTPVSSPRKPDVAICAFMGTVKNATLDQITLTVNDKKISPLIFNSATGVINVNIDLVRGVNTIKLSATNQAGADEKTTQINF